MTRQISTMANMTRQDMSRQEVTRQISGGQKSTRQRLPGRDGGWQLLNSNLFFLGFLSNTIYGLSNKDSVFTFLGKNTCIDKLGNIYKGEKL